MSDQNLSLFDQLTSIWTWCPRKELQPSHTFDRITINLFMLWGWYFETLFWDKNLLWYLGKQTSYWSKTGFFLSLPVEKENNNKFSSQNFVISSQNNVQVLYSFRFRSLRALHIQKFCQNNEGTSKMHQFHEF